MNNRARLFILLLLMIISQNLQADGLPFPVPKLPIEQAISLTKAELLRTGHKYTSNAKSMVITEVKYTTRQGLVYNFPSCPKPILESITDTYFWVITFDYPSSGDVSITYVVLQSGKILVVQETT